MRRFGLAADKTKNMTNARLYGFVIARINQTADSSRAAKRRFGMTRVGFLVRWFRWSPDQWKSEGVKLSVARRSSFLVRHSWFVVRRS